MSYSRKDTKPHFSHSDSKIEKKNSRTNYPLGTSCSGPLHRHLLSPPPSRPAHLSPGRHPAAHPPAGPRAAPFGPLRTETVEPCAECRAAASPASARGVTSHRALRRCGKRLSKAAAARPRHRLCIGRAWTEAAACEGAWSGRRGVAAPRGRPW